MSLLDIDKNEHNLTSLIHQNNLHSLQCILNQHQFAIGDDRDYYTYPYRQDKILKQGIDKIPWDKEHVYTYVLDDINLNKYDDVYGLDTHMTRIIWYLEPETRIGMFTHLKYYFENEDIIVEPIHKSAPILVKNITNSNYPMGVIFKKPLGYNGYVLAVDCDPIIIHELFSDFMIIHEHTIIQELPG